MRQARNDKSGARRTVVLGQVEAARNTVTVKDLVSGEQLEIGRDGLAEWLELRNDEDHVTRST